MTTLPLHRALRGLALLAALCTTRSAFAGEVWNVGGTDAGTISLAEVLVDARDGDLLLLSTGVHETDALIGDRSLTLIGKPGARLRGGLTITGDDPTVSIRLIGLTIEAPPWAGDPALTVRDFAGGAWIQNCVLRGGDPHAAPYPPLALSSEALRVVNARELVLSNCHLYGGPAAPTEAGGLPATRGAAALHNIASRVALFDCSLRGGDGGADAYDLSEVAGEGGVAYFQRSGSRSFLWQTHLRGGDGGGSFGGSDGPGGTGLHNEGWSIDARALRIEGGQGSACGLRVYQEGGRFRDHKTWPREMILSNPNRDDGLMTVLARGVPGESVVLELSLESSWSEGRVPRDSAPEMLGAIGREIPLGLIPPSGMILRRFPTGSLAPNEGSTVFAQLRHETQHSIVRTPPALWVLLDADQ